MTTLTLHPPTHDNASLLLRRLLRIEAEIRLCKSIDELSVLLVNELKSFLNCHQAYYVECKNNHYYIRKVSGSADLDKYAPMVQWLEKELGSKLSTSQQRAEITSLKLDVGSFSADEDAKEFPFSSGLWFPLMPDSIHPIGGVLIMYDHEVEESLLTISTRIITTASHAAKILAYKSPRYIKYPRLRVLCYGFVFFAFLSLFFPVSMTVLAPMEVVATDAFVIAAPIDGVIEKIDVLPNAAVSKGDLLFRYVDTVPRNQLELAEKEVHIAEARLRQMQQNSFVDSLAKREFAQAKADLKLKIAARNFARETFKQSKVYASQSGTAVFLDPKEWVGKPVVTGQYILEIADINKVEIRANLPIAEIVELKKGNRVRVFLDGNPLRPLEAVLYSASLQSEFIEGQGLVYLIKATLQSGEKIPRLGSHGTAQVFSGKTFLGYYLFRRPLTWIRQRTGL